jgi:general secretion pathway protein F
MPTYSYTARDQRGRPIAGLMSAPSLDALADQLKRLGYLVTRTEEVAAGTERRRSAGAARVGSGSLVLVTVQLAKLVQVGIPLVTGLKALEAQGETPAMRHLLGDLARNVEAGSSLSDALRQHPRTFSPLFVSMIRSGEASGKLDEVLQRLAEFGRRDLELREQIATALTYPAILLAAGLGVMAFLVTGVIPKFMVVFVEAGVPLPLPTRVLHVLSGWAGNGWPALLAAAAGGVWAARAGLRTRAGRRAWDRFVMRVPGVGAVVRQIAVARFARTLHTLVASGVPILESLEIAEATVDHSVFGDAIRDVRSAVRQGGTLAEPLRASGVVPPMAVQMIAAGEASGTLEDMLAHLADHFEQMVYYGLKRATAFIEPVFLGIMGGITALIMASVLLPLFRLVSVVQH